MMQNIFVGVMCVIVAAVAVWGWWLENGPEKKDAEDEKNGKDAQDREVMQTGQETVTAESPQKSSKETK